MISIIIPVYNAAPYLDAALTSLYAQTGVELEVIAVDDGSTDESAVILSRWAAAQKNLRVLHQANQGQGTARNLGLSVATGDFVYFMDADDELASPTALARLVEVMAQDSLDVLFFDAETRLDADVPAEGRMVRADYYRRPRDYALVQTGEDLYVDLMKDGAFCVSPPLMLLRHSFLERAGLRFPSERIFYEDNIFATRTVLAARLASHRAWPLYVRKVHAGSTVTTAPTVRHLRGYLACWQDAEKLLAHGPWKDEVREALNDRVGVYRHYARRLMRENPKLASTEGLSPFEQAQVEALRHYPIAEKFATLRRCLRDRGLAYTLGRLGRRLAGGGGA